MAISFGSLGWAALLQKKNYPGATGMLAESILLRHEIGDIGGLAWCFEKLADIARKQSRLERAVRLLGAARNFAGQRRLGHRPCRPA